MHDKFYAVLDTNVLVSALLGASHMSNPTKVLHAVTDNRIIPLYNNEIIEEYKEVLSRKKFPFNEELIDAVLQTILTDGLYVDRTTAIDELFPHSKDIVFYEVSLSKEGSFLVTGNIKHFPRKHFVITPAEMVELLEKAHITTDVQTKSDT